jgi:hypothetical protein
MSAGDVLLMLFGLWLMKAAWSGADATDSAGTKVAGVILLLIGAAVVWWAGWGPSIQFAWSLKR